MAENDGKDRARDELEADVTDAPDEPAESGPSITPKSFLRGLRDTASHMLSEARIEASRAKDEAWRRYESKTKYRRDKD